MFGFFKNLLRKPLSAAAERFNYSSEPAEADYQQPEVVAPAPAPAPVRNKAPAPSNGTGNGRAVEIPLQSILSVLPLELQPRVRQTDVGDVTISVPLEKVLAQLSRGAVRISFGELRQAVPEVFTAENDRDRVLVSLPLGEILPRLNPTLITRRRMQRQVQVPAEVASPFDAQGHGLVVSVGPGKGNSSSTATPPSRQTTATPVPVHSPARSTLTSAPTPAVPTLAPPPAPAPTRVNLKPKLVPPLGKAPPAPAPKAPFVPSPIKVAPPAAPAERVAQPLPPSPPPAPAPIPFAPAAVPVQARPSGGQTDFVRPQEPRKAPEPRPSVSPAPAAPFPQPAAQPSSGGEVLAISLTSLADGWPEAIRKEIVDMSLVDAKIGLPVHAVEQALKQGKIAFTWKILRTWIKPPILPSVSAHDNLVLELPLKVVAPQFLALQRKTAKPHAKVAIDEEIPNLFFGFPQP